MKDKRVVYPISGDDMVSRLGDLTYLVADGDEFKLDVYIPATGCFAVRRRGLRSRRRPA